MPSGIPNFILSDSHQPLAANEPHYRLPTRYAELARQFLVDAAGTNLTQLGLIVESALEAIHLLFTAALHEPTQWELDLLFETFVSACILPCSGGEE